MQTMDRSTGYCYFDIVYPMSLNGKLINSKMKNVIIVIKTEKKLWKLRFKQPLVDAETLKLNRDNSLKEIGKKTNNYADIEGQYIGLLKFPQICFGLFTKCLTNSRLYLQMKILLRVSKV